ncbi:MAG: hypothetical protein WCA35_01655 [Kovacikia sp.]
MVEAKWRPKQRPQDVRVGKFFLLSDFLYSEDGCISGVPNTPVQFDGMEVSGMRGLCKHILDPVVEKFGPLSITFGYVSPTLWRKWNGKNAVLEGLHVFRPAQGGIGGAADILIHSHPDDPRTVLNWIRDNCEYDRLILFPGSSIICVAWTENEPRKLCKEWVFRDGSGTDRHYVNAGRDSATAPPKKKGKMQQGKLFIQSLPCLLLQILGGNHSR